MSEKKNNQRNVKSRTNKILVKKDVSKDVIVEKLSELSNHVKDVKKNVEAIEALAFNSDKTLAVQAQQLAEHMRRTDALEELVHLNKQELEAKDEKIFDEQKELLDKVTEVSTQISNIKTFVAWTAAGIGVAASIAQLIIKFAVK
jgi:cyclopropane fatty-acyl-phospholipid synthase-like methyltransferase